MSGGTIGALVGGIVGAVIGAPFGMAALGWTIGSTLGGVAGTLMDPTVQEAPRLNDTKLQRSQYGAPIAYVWGRFRLAGHVDWIGNNGDLVESGGGGGKGGDSGPTQRQYTGSWSIKFNKSTRRGEPALVSIDKWWATGRVVDEGDINPTVYTGWNLQLPDTSQEADLGVGNAPADRFIGKAVFNQVQMAQFGNALPNMEALVRTVGTTNGPITQLAVGVATSAFPKYPVLTSGFPIATWTIDWENGEVFEPPSLVNTLPFEYYTDVEGVTHRLAHVGFGYHLGHIDPLYHDNQNTPFAYVGAVSPDLDPPPGSIRVPKLSALEAAAGGTPMRYDYAQSMGIEFGRYVRSFCSSSDWEWTIILTSDEDGNDPKWHRCHWGAMIDQGPVGSGIAGTGAEVIHIGSGNFGDNIVHTHKGVVEPNGQYIWVFRTNADFYDDGVPANDQRSIALYYIDEDDNTLKQYTAAGATINSFGHPSPTSAHSGLVFCPGEGYCAVLLGQSTHYALYTRLAGFGEVTLAEVMADVIEMRDGLSTSRFDVSAGEAVIVDGACLGSQMQKRNFVALLQQAYNFDMCESDDGEGGFLKLVFRGGAAVVSIPDEDLGVHAEGEAPRALLEIDSHLQEHELPARVNVQYYDAELDYQIGSQFAQVQSPYVDNVTKIDLPLVLSAAKARNIAKRELWRIRLERDTYRWYTSRKYAYLEPTDVVTVQNRDLRIEKKTEAPNGVITWEGKLSAPYVADQPDDPAPGQGHTPPTPSAGRGATTVEFFDIPMITDDAEDVGFYVAACPTDPAATWTGCSLQKSVDSGVTWAEVAAFSTPSTMGTVALPLGGFSGGNVFDYTNVVTVTLRAGTLESVSELAVLNGTNWAVHGREVYGFTTAEQVDATTWEVSGLLRGRRGTEWAMSTHGSDEPFALASTLLNVATPIAEVGQARQYKAVTYGLTLAATTAVTFTNTAQSARCYAPVDAAGGVTASDAVILQAVARTRRGGDWRDGTDITQADAPAEFVCEIWDATYAQTARVVDGLSTPSYTYAAADQATDFGDEQQTIYFTFAQVGQFGLGLRVRGVAAGAGSTVDPPVDPGNGYNPPPDPPTGGGAVDIELDYPEDNQHSTGFKIGDALVAHFTTTTAPDAGYISVAEITGTPYTRHIILATDVDGNNVVAEAYGPVASITLGTEYSYSIPLDPTEDYYLIVRTESAPGEPSGTPGAAADIAITLLVEL